MSAATHTINNDQRFLRPTSTLQGNGSYNVSAPANANIAPPGMYMLFALNGHVPSVSAVVQIGP
jgi:hypothetical protein